MTNADDIVTLADAKTFLNITGTNFDTELADYVTGASQVWLNHGGPGISSPSYDEWYDGGQLQISLRHSPVIAITSITDAIGPIAYTLTEQDPGNGGGAYHYSVDKKLGLITRRNSGTAVPFFAGKKNVHVVYTAGFTTVPADVKHAVLLLIGHMWETQRGGTRRPGTNSGDDYVPGMGFMLPHRVKEILDSHRIPGIG